MILSHHRKSKKAAQVFLAAFLTIVIWAVVVGNQTQGLIAEIVIPSVAVAAGVSFIVAVWFHILVKGRSAWWLLAMAFNLLGLLILLALRDVAKPDREH